MASLKLKTTKKVLIIHDLYSCMIFLACPFCRGDCWNVQGDGITSELLRKYHLSVRICEKIIIR